MASAETRVPPDPQARASTLRSRAEEPGTSTRDTTAAARTTSPSATTLDPPQVRARSRAEEPGASTRTQGSDPADEARAGKRETADLYVVVYPFGDVWVDDKPAGQAPVALHLSPGSHEIAVGEGRVQERQTVRLRPGESKHLTFRSKPEP
jgi:hypothetical protein